MEVLNLTNTSSSWNIFSAIASKKAGDVKGWFVGEKNPEFIDKDLPLGLHIGSKIELDITPFILHKRKLKAKFPGKVNYVVAYGKIVWNDFIIHNFYIESEGDKEKSVIRIVMEGDGIIECRLFRSLDQIYPQSSDDWGFWLDKKEGQIGWSGFQTKDDEILYQRVWESEGGDFISPYVFDEKLFIDREGSSYSKLRLTSMLYGRLIQAETKKNSEFVEYVLLNCEENISTKETFIHILIGIDINTQTIKVVY